MVESCGAYVASVSCVVQAVDHVPELLAAEIQQEILNQHYSSLTAGSVTAAPLFWGAVVAVWVVVLVLQIVLIFYSDL